MGFFDDSSFACFEFFADTIRRVATEIWADYNMTIAEAKTHTNAWGATDIEPILGVVIDPQQRRWRLSQHKVDKYSANIDDVIALAESTKGNLVPKKDMQQILGRLLFVAKAGIPDARAFEFTFEFPERYSQIF